MERKWDLQGDVTVTVTLSEQELRLIRHRLEPGEPVAHWIRTAILRSLLRHTPPTPLRSPRKGRLGRDPHVTSGD